MQVRLHLPLLRHVGLVLCSLRLESVTAPGLVSKRSNTAASSSPQAFILFSLSSSPTMPPVDLTKLKLKDGVCMPDFRSIGRDSYKKRSWDFEEWELEEDFEEDASHLALYRNERGLHVRPSPPLCPTLLTTKAFEQELRVEIVGEQGRRVGHVALIYLNAQGNRSFRRDAEEQNRASFLLLYRSTLLIHSLLFTSFPLLADDVCNLVDTLFDKKGVLQDFHVDTEPGTGVWDKTTPGDGTIVYLDELHVKPKYRRQGVATWALVQLWECKELRLAVCTVPCAPLLFPSSDPFFLNRVQRRSSSGRDGGLLETTPTQPESSKPSDKLSSFRSSTKCVFPALFLPAETDSPCFAGWVPSSWHHAVLLLLSRPRASVATTSGGGGRGGRGGRRGRRRE
jgi:ribosomal protein S18 acetylase RimI-like enzyme